MNINLHTWFSNRQCDYLPKHFTPTNTYVTDENHLWILEKFQGRYYIGEKQGETASYLLENYNVVYFEDPQEAVFFELKWS